jgi:hypothetical protein
MTLEALILATVPAIAVMIMGWLFTLRTKQSEKVHGIDIRLTKTEEKVHGHGNRITLTEGALQDIQQNMVRKEDLKSGLEALGDRIDDVIRR